MVAHDQRLIVLGGMHEAYAHGDYGGCIRQFGIGAFAVWLSPVFLAGLLFFRRMKIDYVKLVLFGMMKSNTEKNF